jgi:predicted GNAT family N-acyltransferase
VTAVLVHTVRDEAERERCFAIRKAVFVDEQGVALDVELDGHDASATHLLAEIDGRPIGTMRWRMAAPGQAKIERVAVLRDARGTGVGAELIRAAMDQIKASGAEEAVLHAQSSAAAFYQKLGFLPEGTPFLEDGIEHVRMRRSLPR